MSRKGNRYERLVLMASYEVRKLGYSYSSQVFAIKRGKKWVENYRLPWVMGGGNF